MSGPVGITGAEDGAVGSSASLPFLDDAVLEGAPPAARRDFKNPKLRRFPGCGLEIKWLDYLGHGAEGIVFKATVGDGPPVAVKIFWLTKRPEPLALSRGRFRALVWPFEEEARTVALLEKMRWAMGEHGEAGPGQAPRVEPPRTRDEAVDNFFAFSDEARRSTPAPARRLATPTPPFPPVPECHGWTVVGRADIPALSPPVREVVDGGCDHHWAIVYELVPDAGAGAEPARAAAAAAAAAAVGQRHLDFFHAVGFALEPYKPDNWRGGRLVDMNDVCAPLSGRWHLGGAARRDARAWFRERDPAPDPSPDRRRIVRPRRRGTAAAGPGTSRGG